MKIKTMAMAMAVAMACALCARASAQCAPAQVLVSQSAAETATLRDKSLAQLGAYASGLPSGPLGPGRLTGLYEGGMSLRLSFDSAPADRSSGYCVKAVRVKLRWEPVIRIASEIPEESCAGAAALEHEREHQKAHPLAATQALREELKRAPIDPDLTLAQTAEQAERMGQERIASFGQRLAEAMDAAAEKSQRELDTRQEYERVSSACAAGERLKDRVKAAR